ncbi:MAG TPA: YbdD/YjiX family protein [Gemmatimonadales bacterium]|jgi:uncharacterized short protein YbdD (DUF466 family)
MPASPGGGARAGNTLRSALTALRRVLGMPDYRAYVAHLHAAHPERPVPTERAFYDEYVRARYADGPTRCC